MWFGGKYMYIQCGLVGSTCTVWLQWEVHVQCGLMGIMCTVWFDGKLHVLCGLMGSYMYIVV